jgi:PiT family inorganic phosphate transporter
MASLLIVGLGVAVAVFVGFNIGGSSTGIAWGPAIGANLLSKTAAATLMVVFVFLGGWTVGRNVIATLGGEIVPASSFTLGASIAVLFFIGLGILVANLASVPVPTSMTAVGAILGLGMATETTNWGVMGRIFLWWLATPAIAFWVGSIVGRYWYPYLDRRVRLDTSEGPLLELDGSGAIPRPVMGPGTTRRELYGTLAVVVIGCYMSFGAGASNVANAVAPLVGSDVLRVDAAILLGTAAIGLGGFTIARRTMESVGNDLTELPLLAALIVAVVAATITSVLSWMGIPISLVMGTVMTIVGLGWGRASRTATMVDLIRREQEVPFTVSSVAAETPEEVPAIGEPEPEQVVPGHDLVNTRAVGWFVSFWILGPSIAAGLSYAFFRLVPIL